MSKMGSHDPFGYLKHKLWLKEWLGIKVPIWLPTIKSQESPWSTMCRWRATYHWKAFNEGYNFALDFTSIGGLHKKLWASKIVRVPISRILGQKVMGLQSCKSPNFGNFKTPNLGVSRQNDIWVQALWPSTENTIRGKVVASPKSGPWWVLWVLWVYVCPWYIRAPKVLQLCINQLVIWFVQVCVNNWLVYYSS